MTGFIVGPLFYIWLGVALLRGTVDVRATQAKRPDLYCCSV